MIKLISTSEQDGIHEEIWAYILYRSEPETYFQVIKHSTKYECYQESKDIRGQCLVSSIGKFISLEETNGVAKEFSENEALTSLKNMFDAFQEKRTEVEYLSNTILKMDKVIRRLARPGRQYIYYKSIMQMAQEQLDYEKEYNKLG
jgi:hypothetical protein